MRAQALIMAGAVFSGERKIAKAGDMLAEDAPLEVRGKDHPWVSRGGIKLDHGLTHFGIDVTGTIALDVGSSTGGFTDVLLSRGAAKVYAVDVGTNQLAWKLRQDARVIVLEQTNARYLTAEQVPEPVDMVVCDASFISLAKILEAPLKLAKPGAKLYYATMTPEWTEEFVPRMNRFNVFMSPDVPPVTPREEAAVIFELPPDLLELKLQAIEAHVSQVEGMLNAFGKDFFRRAHRAEFFRLAEER